MLETVRAQLQLPTQTLTSAVERLSEMKTHIWALSLTMWRSLVILEEKSPWREKGRGAKVEK